jgi:UDP-N-acetylmuramate dehydrogenase
MAMATNLEKLRSLFGEHLQENVRLANYTTAHVGGLADGMLIAQTSEELAHIAEELWKLETPFHILGTGANVLVSDAGYRGVVIINHAHTIKVNTRSTPPSIWAESGANIGTVARMAMLRGLSGLEWAATVPGTVGGAVYGNAGSQGSDMSTNFVVADILHRRLGRQQWDASQMHFAYRSTILKRDPGQVVILAARMHLHQGDREIIQSKMSAFAEKRRNTQPPGASMGSMFKNPPEDKAGRLIEAAGLKGTRIGGVVVSEIHANFFVNDADATAKDYYDLIQLVRKTVLEKSGVQLELEVELLGDWDDQAVDSLRTTGSMK